jgi:hypothetical protein
LPDGSEHLVGVRQGLTLLGYDVTIDRNCEFAVSSIDQLHLRIGLVLQGRRHTGGERAGRGSGRALTDYDVLHCSPSFLKKAIFERRRLLRRHSAPHRERVAIRKKRATGVP